MFQSLHDVARQVSSVIVGKEKTIRLALTCLLAGGHLLLDDVPGVGKTTLAHALAISLGMQFTRQQFTSDLLPADILGMSVFERDKNIFVFHPGPVFTQLLLADEINRATPKTQSALLEAMEEQQVSIEGTTRPPPTPFFVIATQNPLTQIGVFPLPESQLDRFMMSLSIGYPDPAAERLLLMGEDRRAMMRALPAKMQPAQLVAARAELQKMFCSEKLIDYMQALAQTSRRSALLSEGISPRGALALLQAARATAALEGRDHVIPEDVQQVFVPVIAHRLRLRHSPGSAALPGSGRTDDAAHALLQSVPV